MRDYLDIGPAPCNESCQQVGMPSFDAAKERAELEAFRSQIRRVLGAEPEGAQLSIKAFPHDFGTYREVVCYYDTENEAAAEYAYRCEGNAPEQWDAEARKELGLPELTSA